MAKFRTLPLATWGFRSTDETVKVVTNLSASLKKKIQLRGVINCE